MLGKELMEREVFIFPNGESFWAWDLHFENWDRREHTRPCTFYNLDGTVHEGVVSYTLESAFITFSASLGLQVGQEGQLSASDDRFFQVTISAVELTGDHLRVSGKAVREIHHSRNH